MKAPERKTMLERKGRIRLLWRANAQVAQAAYMAYSIPVKYSACTMTR